MLCGKGSCCTVGNVAAIVCHLQHAPERPLELRLFHASDIILSLFSERKAKSPVNGKEPSLGSVFQRSFDSKGLRLCDALCTSGSQLLPHFLGLW